MPRNRVHIRARANRQAGAFAELDRSHSGQALQVNQKFRRDKTIAHPDEHIGAAHKQARIAVALQQQFRHLMPALRGANVIEGR